MTSWTHKLACIVFHIAPAELVTAYGEWAHLVCCCLSLSLFLSTFSLDRFPLFVFHLFSPFQLTLTSFPPLSTPKPHLSSPPAPISSPPSRWVWLSSLYRGRWGHKTAGEAGGGPRDKVCVWLIVIHTSEELLCKLCARTVINLGAVVTVCAVPC